MTSDFKSTIDWYNNNAESYDANSQDSASLDLITEFRESLFDVAEVFDAGCASGRDSKLLAEKGLQVTGLDISTELIKLAKEKNPDIRFIEASSFDLPFESGSFDGVLAHASLVHLDTTEDVEKSLREFHRVLKKDGVPHVYVKQQQGEEKTSVVSDPISNNQDRFYRWYTRSEVEKLLTSQEFKIFSIQDNYVHEDSKRGTKWIVTLGRKV